MSGPMSSNGAFLQLPRQLELQDLVVKSAKFILNWSTSMSFEIMQNEQTSMTGNAPNSVTSLIIESPLLSSFQLVRKVVEPKLAINRN